MTTHEPGNGSPWTQALQTPTPRLTTDLDVDVLIVGAGYAGLTTAYLLARSGRSICVLDQNQVGHGMSGHTTAHHTVIQDRHFLELAKNRDETHALQLGRAHADAIDLMEHISTDENIACDFSRCDMYLGDSTGSLRGRKLTEEAELVRRTGTNDVETLETIRHAPLDGLRGLRVGRQARSHAGKYLAGLAEACRRRGVLIHGDTRVRATDGTKAQTEDGNQVRADALVLTTHVPPMAKETATKMTPATTYVIAAPVPHGSVHDALYYDTDEPYHYVRLQPWHDGQDLLIVGGADHRPGAAKESPPSERLDQLEQWIRLRIPQVGASTYRWTGTVFSPHDGYAYIGRRPMADDNVYIATGFSGNGTTHGTIAGMLLSALVEGRDHPWQELFEPSRKGSMLSREFLSHNVAAAQHLIGSRLRPHKGSIDELAPGTGAVIGIGTAIRAVYKHEDGRVEEHSAVCTHMRCIVGWNQEATAFECACHGSRFAVDGSVVAGPATKPLAPVDRKKETIPASEHSP